MNADALFDLLSTQDPTAMSGAARDLGRHLATTEDGNLRALRRKIAGVAYPDRSSYGAGFVEALAMVARGFESEREDDEALAARVAAVRTRKHWADALAQIANGCTLPKELAGILALEPSQISHLLEDMTQEGLVVRRDPSEGEDGRTRPFRITPQGRLIAERLEIERDTAPIRSLVEGVVSCIALLVAHGRASRSALADELAEHLDPPAARATLRALTDALAGTSMAVLDDDDSVVPDSIEVQSQLDQLVAEVVREDSPHGDQLVERLNELADSGVLLLRVSNRRDEWDVLVARRRLERVRVVRDDDLVQDPQRLAALGDVRAVLYESGLLAECDQRAEEARLLVSTPNRYVFGVSAATAPEGFKVLPLPLPAPSSAP